VHVRRFLGTALAAAVSFAPLAALAVPPSGQPAPAFSVPTPQGKKLDLSTLKGKPVYLNFFASWCGPCNEEAPSIADLRAKYAKSGVQFVGIDELDGNGQGAAFEKKYHDPYGLVGIDDSGAVGHSYGAIAMPVHVFIDRKGNVVYARMGEMNAGEIEAQIKNALK